MTNLADKVRASPSLVVLVGLVVSTIAAWIVASGVDLARTRTIVAGANWTYLLLALVVIAGQLIVRAARWRLLLPRAAGSSPVPVRRIIPVSLVGYLGNAILPARLGEALRSVVLARREALAVGATLGSAVLERVLDTFVLATLGLLAAVVIGVDEWIARIALIGVAVSVLALGVVFAAPRLLDRIRFGPAERVVAVIRGVADGAAGQHRSALAGAIGLSVVAWGCDATTYWLVARALDIPVEPVGAMLVSAVTVLSTAVPSAPGYVGTFELAAVAAAATLGIDHETGLAFALVAHAIAVIPVSITGAVAVLAMGVSLRGVNLRASPVG